MFYDFVKDDFDKYTNNLGGSKIGKIINYSFEGGKCIRPFIVKHLIQILSKNTLNIWQIPVLTETLLI